MGQIHSGPDWLKLLTKEFVGRQLWIFAFRLVQLAAQICAFWYAAHLVYQVTVARQAVSFIQTLPLVVAMVLWALSIWLVDWLSCNLKERIEQALEDRVHIALANQQLALTRRYSTTFWQQLLLHNVSDVGEYLTQYCVQKWLAVVSPLFVVLVVLPVNYMVAICLLLTLPIVPIFMVLVGNGAANLHRKHFHALERLGDMFSDRLKGLALITATGQHNNQQKRLQAASRIANQKTMKVVSLAFLSASVLDFFSTVAIALVAVFIGFSMLGEISIGLAISLQQGLFMLLVAPLLFAEMRVLGRYYHQKSKAEAASERFADVLSVSSVKNNKRKIIVAPFTGFRWLNFALTTPRLHAAKLHLMPGDWVALTGDSGSGKSVTLEALMGFRNATHCIGADAAMLTQQACIVDGSLAFNLHLGKQSFTQQALLNVLDEVELMTWFSGLPKGLDTQLGDSPAMSGGEAQRLALARILLQKKEVVLLDEPTAHLTASQHQQLAELIHQKLCGKTVIWASHKPLPKHWFAQHWLVAENEITTTQCGMKHNDFR